MLVTHQILTVASDTVWDPFMMVLLIGLGIFLTFRYGGFRHVNWCIPSASCSNVMKREAATYRHFVL